MKVLVIYATTEGQTRKISSFVADHLSGRGHTAVLVDASDAPLSVDVGRFDAVLIAASVHVGRYQASVIHFIKEHLSALDAKHTAFVSVSLSAASNDPDDVAGLKSCLAAFLTETRWTPGRIHHVAGAFRYTAYDFFKRWAMKYIAHRKGAPTDAGRDHELTDWDDLARFVDAFLADAAKPAP